MDIRVRVAVVKNEDEQRIKRYMPSNYGAVQLGFNVYIVGTDVAGWTMQDYVIPRLLSGNIYAEEIDFTDQDNYYRYQGLLGPIAQQAVESLDGMNLTE